MKKGFMLKFLIILVIIIILIIIIILSLLKKKDNPNINEVFSDVASSTIQEEKNTEEYSDTNIDISDVWYHLNDLSHYKTILSFETYIQKYFEKNKFISDFAGFNINDVWCYTKIQNEQNIEEYYIEGYIYNLDFSDIKEIAIKFSLNENNAFKIEIIDLANTSWNSILNNKVQEIKDNWTSIEHQFDIDNSIDETNVDNDSDENEIDIIEELDDDENIGPDDIIEEPKPVYNENEFIVLDITDKDLINRYFINFKIKTLINEQEAYSLLHKDTKERLFKSNQEFESGVQNYLNNNTTINKIKVVKSIVEENGLTSKLVQYIVADGNGNMFGIEITGINDYTVAITKK